MEDFKREMAAVMAKITPPAGVSAWIMAGNHLDTWIKVATLAYIVVQMAALIVGKWLTWTGRVKNADK